MSTNAVVANVLSYVALACMTLMLLPQAYLHVRQQSTRGLSTCMLVIFLIASLMSGSYDYLTRQPVAITLAWAGFSILAIVCLCQVSYYEPSNMLTRSLSERRVRFVISLFGSCFLCCAMCIGVYFMLIASLSVRVNWLPEAFGYIVPNVLNVTAYCVQFRLIIVTQDASGLSLGFLGFDTSAGIVSILAIAFDRWDGAAAAPYFVIIACQFIMAILYFIVYPVKSKVKNVMNQSIKLSQIEFVDMSDLHSVVTDSPDSRSEHDSDFMLDSDESDFELDSDDENDARMQITHRNDDEDHIQLINQSINRTILHSINMSDHWISEPRHVQPIR